MLTVQQSKYLEATREAITSYIEDGKSSLNDFTINSALKILERYNNQYKGAQLQTSDFYQALRKIMENEDYLNAKRQEEIENEIARSEERIAELEAQQPSLLARIGSYFGFGSEEPPIPEKPPPEQTQTAGTPAAGTGDTVEAAANTPPEQAAEAQTPQQENSGQAPTMATTHTVQPGNTLSGIIEAHFGSSNPALVEQIAAANNIANPDLIFPGQQITMPLTQEQIAIARAQQQAAAISTEVAGVSGGDDVPPGAAATPPATPGTPSREEPGRGQA